MAVFPSGYTFPILNSDGSVSSTIVDMADMFVPKDIFLNGGLYAWGHNQYGSLGNGTVTYYSSPIQVGTLTTWKQVASGGYFTTATKTDGTLWAWGYNRYGQLGNGAATTVYYSSPIQVGALTNWKQVITNNYYTFGLKTDGTLWAWGQNNAGQLGNNTIVNYLSPIQVGALTNWKQVSCASNWSAAIKTDGTLWTWGFATSGRLGNNLITPNYSSPIVIGALTNWKQISCGYDAGTAIKTDGTLWAWGDNTYGQLGNGTITSYSSPIQIGTLTNWKQISSGTYNSVAIKTDGTLWAWGNNQYGTLGNNTVTYYSSPIQIGALTNWKQISNGYVVSAIKTDGTLWAWGQGSYGQIGNNTVTYYSSPIQVGALTTWKQTSAGGFELAAIQAPELP